VSSPEDVDQTLILRLAELGVEFVQPPNPYCLNAIVLGTAEDPRVSIRFWRGRVAGVDVNAERGIPPEKLPAYIEALQRAYELIAALAAEPQPDTEPESPES
jgi:hypothetical protein